MSADREAAVSLEIALAERYKYTIYDAMILASAQLADCPVVFTEDLQQDQDIDGRLKVTNPFSQR